MKKIKMSNNGLGLGDDGDDSDDKISCLPHGLRCHILSFLPIKRMVQTCVLSKTWKHLWRSVPSLDLNLDDGYFNKNLQSFENFVDSIFRLHDGSDYDKIRLYYYNKPFDDPSKVNSWILHVTKHNVQHLELDGSPMPQLPPCLFTCSSLRVLKLNSMCICISTSICLPFLKILHLEEVTVSDPQIIEALSSTCPALESLTLKRICLPDLCKSLKISVMQLRKLALKGNNLHKIFISSPNITSLKLRNWHSCDLCFVDDIISLVDVHIDVPFTCFDSRTQYVGLVQTAQFLTLSLNFIESVANQLVPKQMHILDLADRHLPKQMHILDYVCIPFNNLKLLKLKTTFEDSQILVINTLLKHCPNIERLILKTHYSNGYYPSAKVDQEVWFEYMLPRLKMVRIQYFDGCENSTKLLKLLLKNAPVLERFIVEYDEMPKDMKMQTAMNLLNYSRAFSSVGMLFI